MITSKYDNFMFDDRSIAAAPPPRFRLDKQHNTAVVALPLQQRSGVEKIQGLRNGGDGSLYVWIESKLSILNGYI